MYHIPMISIERPYSRNIQEFLIQKEYNSKIVIDKGKSDIFLRTQKAHYLLKLFSDNNFPVILLDLTKPL